MVRQDSESHLPGSSICSGRTSAWFLSRGHGCSLAQGRLRGKSLYGLMLLSSATGRLLDSVPQGC
jgi:hypothetical protein